MIKFSLKYVVSVIGQIDLWTLDNRLGTLLKSDSSISSYCAWYKYNFNLLELVGLVPSEY